MERKMCVFDRKRTFLLSSPFKGFVIGKYKNIEKFSSFTIVSYTVKREISFEMLI